MTEKLREDESLLFFVFICFLEYFKWHGKLIKKMTFN